MLGAIKHNAKHYVLQSPEGKLVNIYNMKEFCKNYNLSTVRMCRLNRGEILEHKGWTNPKGLYNKPRTFTERIKEYYKKDNVI